MVTQSSLSTLLVVDLLPCTHWVHPAEPAPALKDPAGQGTHGPTLGPKKPAAQVQFVRVVLPVGASKSRGLCVCVSQIPHSQPTWPNKLFVADLSHLLMYKYSLFLSLSLCLLCSVSLAQARADSVHTDQVWQVSEKKVDSPDVLE